MNPGTSVITNFKCKSCKKTNKIGGLRDHIKNYHTKDEKVKLHSIGRNK